MKEKIIKLKIAILNILFMLYMLTLMGMPFIIYGKIMKYFWLNWGVLITILIGVPLTFLLIYFFTSCGNILTHNHLTKYLEKKIGRLEKDLEQTTGKSIKKREWAQWRGM